MTEMTQNTELCMWEKLVAIMDRVPCYGNSFWETVCHCHFDIPEICWNCGKSRKEIRLYRHTLRIFVAICCLIYYLRSKKQTLCKC